MNARWMLPGRNSVTCPRPAGGGSKRFRLPTGIVTGIALSFWYPKTAS